jgi:hypothetical protein
MKKKEWQDLGVSMDSATTLASLAMLKVNIDDGKDYLEYLRPYVIQVLSKTTPDVVNDTSVAAGLREICGLEIPSRTVNIVLQRLAKDKYLIKENGVYKITHLPETNFEADKADSSRHLEFVCAELTKFAKETAERDLTNAEATNSIVAFLSQFSIPCLRSFLRGTTLPDFNNDGNWQIVLVGQFVSQLENKPQLFESFLRFVQGHMLANALLCPDLHSVSSTYDGVSFYLDTPLLIQLLGLEGKEEQQAVDETLRLVSRLKGKLCYFSHTQDELVNSIRISSDFVDNPKGRGSIVTEARKSGRKKSDLLLMAENAADRLGEMGIICVPTPSYDQQNHRFEIGEEAFSEILDDEINYYNLRAKDYDIRSVRSIYVLRKGLIPASVEKSRAVFVTSNVSFSKAAYEYGKKYEQSREVSTVITDFSLANTAWLKAPQGAPLLPQKEVLAFAYAAIQPAKGFWDKVLAEAEKLQESGRISARDHQLLRSNQHVQQELMKLTLGADESLNGETITKTIQRVTDEIRAEDAVVLQAAAVRNAELEKRLQSELSKNNLIKEKIYWDADKRANKEASFMSFLIWVAQILISIVGIVTLWLKPSTGLLAYVIIGAGVGSSILRLIGTRWDTKPVKARPAYVEWRRSGLIRSEYGRLSISEDEPTVTV